MDMIAELRGAWHGMAADVLAEEPNPSAGDIRDLVFSAAEFQMRREERKAWLEASFEQQCLWLEQAFSDGVAYCR